MSRALIRCLSANLVVPVLSLALCLTVVSQVAALVLGTLQDGTQFWKSSGDFDYVYGATPRQLIVGFDAGSFGMSVGEVQSLRASLRASL